MATKLGIEASDVSLYWSQIWQIGSSIYRMFFLGLNINHEYFWTHVSRKRRSFVTIAFAFWLMISKNSKPFLGFQCIKSKFPAAEI